jgi:NAD(P)-dependent dehydrogenase (short-subunit alcohol dehydrogenase family)
VAAAFPEEAAAHADKACSQGTFREQQGSEIPLERIAQPDDIASTAAFLASDDARWITGQVIYCCRR